jgi:hypothetical protein
MRYPCYALDVTQSFEEKALLCTNLGAQPHRNDLYGAAATVMAWHVIGRTLCPKDRTQLHRRDPGDILGG